MGDRALIIGYGNTLRGDDGLGPHVAERLAADLLPADRRIACHELTPELAVPLSEAALVIFVDVSRDRQPGEVTCERIVAALPDQIAFSHALTPTALLALARDLYGASPPAWLLSAGADTLDFTEGLSPAVLAAMPALRDRLRALLTGEGATTHA
jgi:hydrogenase maturation protease